MKTSGIYSIINTTNGKRYVGSAIDLRHRLWDHKRKLERGVHKNAHLQNAWNKYGPGSFNFAILLCCPVDQILLLEQQAIDEKAEYNIASVAGNCLGVKHTLETRAKYSKARTGQHPDKETRAKMAAAQTGRRHSIATREKMSASNKGMKKSPEYRAAMSAARKGEDGPFWGRHHTEETKLKIAKGQRRKPIRTGWKHTAETKEKIRAAHIGKPKSPEFCALMSEARKGEKSFMWGTCIPEETKIKMSAARKAWWDKRKAVNE